MNATVNVGTEACCIELTPDGSKAFVTTWTYGHILVIDTARRVITGTVPIDARSSAVRFSPDGLRGYTAHGDVGARSISIFDTSSNTVTATTALGEDYIVDFTVTPDGRRLYATSYDPYNPLVFVIDALECKVMVRIPVLPHPYGIAIAPDGNHVYVTHVAYSGLNPHSSYSNHQSRWVSVIDTAQQQVTATIRVDLGPFGVAVSPDSRRVYVTHLDVGSLTVVDTASSSPIGRIPLSVPALGLAITRDGRYVCVTHKNARRVSVIDTFIGKVVRAIPLDVTPYDLAITPDGKDIYISSNDSKFVSIVSVYQGD